MYTLLIWVVTVLYVGQAIVSIWYGQYAHTIIFTGYAAANIGLIWAMKG
jgi:uncharacterized MnhB-related membrane protein